MGKDSRLRKVLQYGVAALLAALVLGIAWLHVEQRILRYRAEHLLVDIVSLQLRTATYYQAQAVFDRWKKWGSHKSWTYGEQPCTTQNCTFYITLEGPIGSVGLSFVSRLNDETRIWIEHLLLSIGLRQSIVRVVIIVRDDVVWDKGILVNLATKKNELADEGYTPWYDLVVDSESVLQLYPPHGIFDIHYWDQQHHLEYAIGGPGGCTGCKEIDTRFTPYADPKDIQMLMDVDFSCLTRWKPCEERSDILPKAAAQEQGDRQRYEGELAKGTAGFRCNNSFAELMARDAEDAIVADVTAADKMVNEGLTVRLVDRLKRGTAWNIGEQSRVRIDGSIYPRLGEQFTGLDVRVGDRVILLSSSNRDAADPTLNGPWLEVCGVLPLNQENLETVRRGIARDERPADLANFQTSWKITN